MLSQTKQPAMKKLPFILLIFISVSVCSQDRSKFLYAEFSDRSITLYPFTRIGGSTFDPVVTLGGGIDYKQKRHSILFQTFQLSGYSDGFSSVGWNISSSIGYRFPNNSGFFGEVMAGICASAFFSEKATFIQEDDGRYVQANPVHIVGGIPFDFLIGYSKGKYSFYIKYRYMAEGPLSENLPVLSTSTIGIGIRYTLTSKAN